MSRIITMEQFIDWDPYFVVYADEEPDEAGLVWLHDAEGYQLIKCYPEAARVVAAALEYAQADVAAIYGIGFGNLTNEQIVKLLRQHMGQHPHVGLPAVE